MYADSGFKRRQFQLWNNKLHIAGKRLKCIALPESTLRLVKGEGWGGGGRG